MAQDKGQASKLDPKATTAKVGLIGMTGEVQSIVACNHYRDESDPRNTGGPAGLPGKYQVTFLLGRPGFKETKEYEFAFIGPHRGNSHLAITKPAFTPPGDAGADHIKVYANTPYGRFEFTGFPNQGGFLGKIVSEPFDASSRDDAQKKAYGALLPAMSDWSVHLDIPLQVEVVETTELRTGNAGIIVVAPFYNAPFAVQGHPPEHDSEFAHYASLYREALNSNSPVYRFLCLFKIIEGIRFRRARLGKESAASGKHFHRPTETIPSEKQDFVPWLNAIFPIRREWDEMTVSEIFVDESKGKRISQLVGTDLTALRNEIAHGILRSGELALSVDDLVHVQRANKWLPLTRCIARRMLKNEFPSQFLSYLKEDGTITE
jgi:hypothetical protein